MGSYGFGPARVPRPRRLSSSPTSTGISWPRAIAPFDVELVTLGKPGSEERALSDALYDELRAAGLQTLYDDRDAGPGREVRRRRAARLSRCASPSGGGRSPPASSRCRCAAGASARAVPLGTGSGLQRRGGGGRRAVAQPPLTPSAHGRERSPTKRRLFGIDRSGPPPKQTRSDQPLNPWTLPNAIGFVRLALIPVFLVVAFSSADGQTALAAVLFAVIGWADYLDGFTARLTGPVQPARRAAGPDRRPAARHLRDGCRAGTSRCCHAGRSRS